MPVRAYPAPVQLAKLDVTFILSAVLLRCEGRVMDWLRDPQASHPGKINPHKGLEKALTLSKSSCTGIPEWFAFRKSV